jgi:hypothetical protein
VPLRSITWTSLIAPVAFTPARISAARVATQPSGP